MAGANNPKNGVFLPQILIAEDNPVNQKLATILVQKIGLPYEAVSTGRQAVEAIQRTEFGMILMDVQMPEMDGLEATAEIRANGGDKADIPIIAMTAHAMNGERERCLAAGMNDYLTKPVTREQLAEVVAKWLGGVNGVRAAIDKMAPQSDALDRSVLERLRSMQEEEEPDIIGELVDIFVGIVPDQIAQIKAAMEAGDNREVERIAHSVKGSCRNLGARRMAEICNMLEQLGAKNFTKAVPFLVSQLENEYARVEQALTAERESSNA